jgi:hypothetical protein
MGCHHLNAMALGEIAIQAVAVVGFVSDQSRREGVGETVHQDPFDELAFMRRRAFDTNGEKKTVIIDENIDLRPIAALGGPDRSGFYYKLSDRETGARGALLSTDWDNDENLHDNDNSNCNWV